VRSLSAVLRHVGEVMAEAAAFVGVREVRGGARGEGEGGWEMRRR